LQSIDDGRRRRIELPAGARIGAPLWSPDGKQIAFTRTTENSIELWVANVAEASAKAVPGVKINAAYGEAVQWLPDSRTLLVQTIDEQRGAAPTAPQAPVGPTIEES